MPKYTNRLKHKSHYEKDVLFEVPEGWTKCCLYDIVSADCTLGYGIVQPMDDITDGVPVVRPVDLTTQIIRNNGLKRIDPTISEAYQRTILKGGEILFCVRASVGKLGIASPELKGANVTRGISPIRFDYESLTKYVFYHLQSFFSQNEIKHYSRGATLQQINVEDLKKLSIALPPLDEQKRIVNELEQWLQVCDIIEDSETKLTDSLSIIKNKILDLAIHGKLVPQDANDEPASELLKRINPKAVASCDNPHYEQAPFEIPDNWVWVRIDEINKFKSKSVNPQNYPTDQFELYSVPTFETGNPEFPYGKDVASSKVEVEEGDVLLCKINPHLNRVWVVRRRISQLKSLASSEWIVIRTDKIMPEYLAITMQSPYFRELMMSNVSGVGGSLMRAQPTFVKQYMIPIPPIREQKRIVAKIQEAFNMLDSIAESLN